MGRESRSQLFKKNFACIPRLYTVTGSFTDLGVEIKYEMYCPLVLSIDVLRLEKRLDDHLRYLRDCLPDFSTFPFDLDAEPLPEGVSVPINPVKVKKIQ